MHFLWKKFLKTTKNKKCISKKNDSKSVSYSFMYCAFLHKLGPFSPMYFLFSENFSSKVSSKRIFRPIFNDSSHFSSSLAISSWEKVRWVIEISSKNPLRTYLRREIFGEKEIHWRDRTNLMKKFTV